MNVSWKGVYLSLCVMFSVLLGRFVVTASVVGISVAAAVNGISSVYSLSLLNVRC